METIDVVKELGQGDLKLLPEEIAQILSNSLICT
jgi:hypothetical protein